MIVECRITDISSNGDKVINLMTDMGNDIKLMLMDTLVEKTQFGVILHIEEDACKALERRFTDAKIRIRPYALRNGNWGIRILTNHQHMGDVTVDQHTVDMAKKLFN